MEGVNRSDTIRRAAAGSAWAIGLVVVLGGAMFPLRSHLNAATTALVLVVPVVIGVVRGGFAAGIVATTCGFFVYDFVFIRPYYTLNIGVAENWAAVGVYVVVMVVVARVVAQVNLARAEAQRRAVELRRLFDLSELAVRETPLPELLDTIVTTVRQAFDVEGAALLLPVDGRLSLMASAGAPLSQLELDRLAAAVPEPVSLEASGARTGGERGVVVRGGMQVIALNASDQAIGLLALRGLPAGREQLELLRAFANHLALAIERDQLRDQAVRARLLEEVDRLRRSLVSAVSHDLRTPLATIKVSTSTLLDPEATLSSEDARELVGLVDAQADRLERLVANLLDMTRIQSGTLELRRKAVSVGGLLDEAASVLGSSTELSRLVRDVAPDLPSVEVDEVLIRQVLANLIDNALRYAPASSAVTVSARTRPDGRVEVAVSDRGPGVGIEEQISIFQMVNRRESGGRGGLGLAIAKAFVEAHGEQIWVESPSGADAGAGAGGESGGGARFAFSLPAAVPARVA
jgi:two-component system sensor histidine kinase KdpD